MSSADPLLPLREGRHARELVTPEGVPLVFRLAPLGERLGALLIDLLLQLAGLFLLGLVPLLMGLGSGWLMALVTLVFFFARNFYFVFFELRWQGQTPGKRTIGLRVIDASGGVLTAEAIFARNLTRELEVFWPLVALAAPKQVSGLEGGWLALAAVAWILALGLIPFLNRDRRRLGDLVAGTLVVRMPRELLLEDLGRSRARESGPAPLEFSPEQLDVYGIYELQVLEDLLRQRTPDRGTLETVAAKIQAKIGWQARGRTVPAREFLGAFYQAQRGRLERSLLLGKARRRKR